jgi:proline iminopeptidase
MSALKTGDYQTRLNGVDLAYTIRGQGPVLIAHSGGPGMDARGWADFAGLDQNFTIVQIHPRGSGLSSQPADGSYFLSDYAADLEALRVHLGLELPALIGWSHGGMVAQQYAIEYPGKLSKLILYDTAAYFGGFLDDIETAVKEFKDQPWFEDSFEALQKEWAGDYETAEDMAALWPKEMKFYFKDYNQRAESYQQATGHLPIYIESLKFFNENEAEAMDLRRDLEAVETPTLIIVGRHDFITNVAMAKEMEAHLPNATLEIFEDSGHFAHIEQPEKFSGLVTRFLTS